MNGTVISRAAIAVLSALLLICLAGSSSYFQGLPQLKKNGGANSAAPFGILSKSQGIPSSSRNAVSAAESQGISASAALPGNTIARGESEQGLYISASTLRGTMLSAAEIHPSSGTSVAAKYRQKRAKYSNRRLLNGNSCSNKDISISQGRDIASGIPQYIVQIVNTCMSDCAPSDIHVYCGWFASAPLVNPSAFKRVQFNDCLVNNGKPLKHGEIVRFQYANSFMYPLRFKSAKFC